MSSTNAAGDNPDNVVTRWFGPAFYQLHPLLQALHHRGGILCGDIAIDTGGGLAGLIGRRLARRLGMPLGRSRCGFEVQIVHEADALLWRRRFDDGGMMISRFVGNGHFPTGSWTEQTGPLQLSLGVDIVDGGWRWRLREARWHGLRVPLALLPRSRAGKRIVDGRYAFEVEFRLPLLGRVLRYGGLLDAQPADR